MLVPPSVETPQGCPLYQPGFHPRHPICFPNHHQERSLNIEPGVTHERRSPTAGGKACWEGVQDGSLPPKGVTGPGDGDTTALELVLSYWILLLNGAQ